MNDRAKSILIGVVLGAVIGAVFGIVVGESNETRAPGTRGSLAAVSPGDYMKVGIAVLTLAREFSGMLKKS